MATVVIKKSQGALTRSFIAFLRRFHLLIFFVFIVACLSASVILINQTLTDSSAQEYTSRISAGTIDQPTLERVQSLHTSGQPAQPTPLPQGRVNPFAE
jgi:hypothetical protein